MRISQPNCTHPRRSQRRYGGRRRYCCRCGRTFRVRPRRRGRCRKRAHKTLAQQFVHNEILPARVHRRGTPQSTHQRHRTLARSRQWSAHQLPDPQPPRQGQLILIADGLVKYLDGKWHTWYCLLVRSVHSDHAVILPPYHRQGTEVVAGWDEAIKSIPAHTQKRIVALVSDGHRGLVRVASQQDWMHQRCHFHLIKRLQAQRSRWSKGRHCTEAHRIYTAVNTILTDTHEPAVRTALHEIEVLAQRTHSREVQVVLRGFRHNYREYRTYLDHPELRLPTTSNTAESFINLIERLCSRARGFRSVRVLNEWIAVLIKTKQTIACRKKDQPN